MADMPTVRLRVTELREKRRWTQSELAQRSGVRQPSISKIESEEGTRGVDFVTLARLAQAFAVHPGDLFAWDGKPAKPGARY